ncbi:hypothetical protein V3C99_012282 [Haemonchus contortus]
MQEECSSTSDDEEVLFTKDMVRRLRKSAAQHPSSRPTSSLSDTSGVSTMSAASGQKTKSEVEGTGTDVPLSADSPMKERRTDDELIVTPRTRARVIREIWEACDDGDGFAGGNNLSKNPYISKKLSEFNNTIRLLETKKEEALWREDYAKAAEIENCLKYCQAREGALQELIRERTEALSRHDYATAQRAKTLYEETIESALQNSELGKLLSKQEIQRLRRKESD